jgi:hypothetical protein
MFERLTDDARRAVVLAQEEAVAPCATGGSAPSTGAWSAAAMTTLAAAREKSPAATPREAPPRAARPTH